MPEERDDITISTINTVVQEHIRNHVDQNAAIALALTYFMTVERPPFPDSYLRTRREQLYLSYPEYDPLGNTEYSRARIAEQAALAAQVLPGSE